VLDLNEVVTDIEQLLGRTLGEHIELQRSLDPALWPVNADPGQIEQVLVNLAVNARDAMPEGGSMTIDTANVDVDADVAAVRPPMQPGPHVRLRVSDTGVGMSAEVRARVFDPFFTTKPKGTGSGLGLATVYGIVTQAGGHVDVYSELGLGTTFNVFLPRAESTEPDDAERHAAPAPAKGTETVLVVEDENGVRELTCRMLDRNGYTVLEAASGSDAIGMLRDLGGRVDLLVTDVVMPQMGGREVAEAVRKLQPDVHVLYVSGYAHPVLGRHGTLDEGVLLLEKPFTEAALLAHVRTLLDGAH
jgi:CheY-like chemotaxis protein